VHNIISSLSVFEGERQAIMALGLLGLKVGMTQVYDDQGVLAPVTVVQLGPCPILQVRNAEKDGYHAVQLGFLDKPRRQATRPERGHVSGELESKRRRTRTAAGVTLPAKPNCEPQRHVREFRLPAPIAELTVGKVLTAPDVFKDVKSVDVIGTSKGRGMTGVMKRHNFGGLRMSHGVKKGSRQHGSIASNASNRGSGRPKKGIRMAGHYGAERVTIRNLRVVKIDGDNHVMLIQGAVPGPNGGLVMVRPTNKKDLPKGGPVKTEKSAAKKGAAITKKK
jgi:large subunit ribosomal protein L3